MKNTKVDVKDIGMNSTLHTDTHFSNLKLKCHRGHSKPVSYFQMQIRRPGSWRELPDQQQCECSSRSGFQVWEPKTKQDIFFRISASEVGFSFEFFD